MAKVVGLGGIFFKSADPAKLRAWYAQALGMAMEDHGCMLAPATVPRGAYHLWSPFAASTKYFEPSNRDFMINLMVDDLDGALAQVRAAGGHTMPDVERSEYGDFGWFVDPEGNKVELWQPPVPVAGKGEFA